MTNYFDNTGREYDLDEILREEDEIDDFPVETCPVCGSSNTIRGEFDFLECLDCGYKEVEDEDIVNCYRCGTPTPKEMLTDGLCPECVDELEK